MLPNSWFAHYKMPVWFQKDALTIPTNIVYLPVTNSNIFLSMFFFFIIQLWSVNAKSTTIVHMIVTATSPLISASQYVLHVSAVNWHHVKPSITTPCAPVWKDSQEILGINALQVRILLFYNWITIFNTIFHIAVGCRSNSDCPSNEACVNGKCVDPCRCTPGSICEVKNHFPVCKCPPGTTGDPATGCRGILIMFDFPLK